MAVYLVFGLPRQGKTSYLTWSADRALRGKKLNIGYLWGRSVMGDFAPYKRVYSNFPLKGAYQLDFAKLGQEEFRDCLILIDEIMLLCDSRDWKNYSKPLRDFMALHGHYRCDIVAASQSYSDCDVRIRNLAEHLYYVKRVGVFACITPIQKRWRIDETIQDGYSLESPLSSRFIFLPRLWKKFDSFAAPELPKNTALPW